MGFLTDQSLEAALRGPCLSVAFALLGGCSLGEARDSLTCVQGIERIDAAQVRIHLESPDCPLRVLDAAGNPLNTRILRIGDRISISDPHYGADVQLLEIGPNAVTVQAYEQWHYPTGAEGGKAGRIRIRIQNAAP